jgi:hypothetical protein
MSLSKTVEAYHWDKTTFPVDLKLPDKVASPLSNPPLRVVSEFYRTTGKMHGAIDLAASVGDPIFNVEEGTVRWITWDSPLAGRSVTIQGNTSGLHYIYCHMNAFSSKLMKGYKTKSYSGTPIARGEQIGIVGMTGHTTGPHLHLATCLYVNPSQPFVDPRDVLPASLFSTSGPTRPSVEKPTPKPVIEEEEPGFFDWVSSFFECGPSLATWETDDPRIGLSGPDGTVKPGAVPAGTYTILWNESPLTGAKVTLETNGMYRLYWDGQVKFRPL